MYRDISLRYPLRIKHTMHLPKPGLQHASRHNPCRQVDITPVASLGISSMQFKSLIILAQTMHKQQAAKIMNSQILDKFKRQQKKETLLSSFQSQAATARNVGSLLAHFVTFWIICNRNDDSVTDGGGDTSTDDRTSGGELKK